jgi:hypothetical protein
MGKRRELKFNAQAVPAIQYNTRQEKQAQITKNIKKQSLGYRVLLYSSQMSSKMMTAECKVFCIPVNPFREKFVFNMDSDASIFSPFFSVVPTFSDLFPVFSYFAACFFRAGEPILQETFPQSP